jgi:23S rRNA (cytosine1962-C5)-methyltransferase
MVKVTLKKGRARPLWHGHPWVYAQAIASIDGDVEDGDRVAVCDDRGVFIGTGILNQKSAIAVRLFERQPDRELDATWLREKLDRALALRRRMGLPNEQTDCYRLVNSEGDGLSGLVIDVYARAAVIQFTALAMQQREEQIVEALLSLLSPDLLVVAAPGSFAETERLLAGPRVLLPEKTAPQDVCTKVECRELELRYEVDLLETQKTGLFLDQRQNHALVRDFARGARVLDLYAYHGGFALNAAAAGASSVTAVDASSKAVAAITANARRNHLSVVAVEADVFRYLREVAPQSVDLVVLDPPKFARSRREVDSAKKGYLKLHRQAMATLAPGGILVSAICTQLVSLEDLCRIAARAAGEEKRTVQLLATHGAACDHPRPVAFDEGDYLKLIVLGVD